LVRERTLVDKESEFNRRYSELLKAQSSDYYYDKVNAEFIYRKDRIQTKQYEEEETDVCKLMISPESRKQ
jgi:hypothetical protein